CIVPTVELFRSPALHSRPLSLISVNKVDAPPRFRLWSPYHVVSNEPQISLPSMKQTSIFATISLALSAMSFTAKHWLVRHSS
ncbi:MAG: hypothetical protein WB696_00880, partial [Chthoniobacterales bacterium]